MKTCVETLSTVWAELWHTYQYYVMSLKILICIVSPECCQYTALIHSQVQYHTHKSLTWNDCKFCLSAAFCVSSIDHVGWSFPLDQRIEVIHMCISGCHTWTLNNTRVLCLRSHVNDNVTMIKVQKQLADRSNSVTELEGRFLQLQEVSSFCSLFLTESLQSHKQWNPTMTDQRPDFSETAMSLWRRRGKRKDGCVLAIRQTMIFYIQRVFFMTQNVAELQTHWNWNKNVLNCCRTHISSGNINIRINWV